MKPNPDATRPALEDCRLFSRYWGWFLVIVLLVCEYGLFRQHVLREVAWAYPANFDQASYLFQAYGDYEKIVTKGLLPGLESGLLAPAPTGIMLQTQAALLFLMLGPTRLSALTLSFLYFALLQCVLVHTLRWFTKQWSVALIGLGLLLVSTSRFFWAGGLVDFRIDSIASSLYGVTLCLAIRSRNLQSRYWALVCGAVAALFVLFRFVAITYLLGMLACFLAYLVTRGIWRSRDPLVVAKVKTQAYGLMLAILPIAGLAMPVLVFSRKQLYSYYIVGHLVGKEQEIRAKEFGAVGFFNYYSFYPLSLCRDHLGASFIGLALLLVAAFAVCRFSRGPRRLRDEQPDGGRELQDSFALSLFSFLVPLALFTYDTSKSPVVASVLVVPVVWLIMLGGLWVSRADVVAENPIRAGQGALVLVAVLALLGGTGTEFVMSAKQFLSPERQNEQPLLEAYDHIGAYCEMVGWKTPRFVVDRVLDSFSGSVVPVTIYERSRLFLTPEVLLGSSIFEVKRDDALRDVRTSDIAVITTNLLPADENSLYPFTREMTAMRADLLATASASMVPLEKLNFAGRDLAIFVRPSARVEGGSGGWLTSAGATIRAPALALKSRHHIVLEGQTILSDQIGGKLRVVARLLTAAEPHDLPTQVSPITANYRIVIDLEGQSLPSEGWVDIALSFDRYFVPENAGSTATDDSW